MADSLVVHLELEIIFPPPGYDLPGWRKSPRPAFRMCLNGMEIHRPDRKLSIFDGGSFFTAADRIYEPWRRRFYGTNPGPGRLPESCRIVSAPY